MGEQSKVARAKQRLDALKATKAWRVWSRYGQQRGPVLAGGIAYVAFFSVFPMLAVGFFVFGLVLGGDAGLQAKVAGYLDTSLPGVIRTPSSPTGLVSLAQLQGAVTLNWTGAIALVTLLLSGLGWLGALREGIRAMFGQPTFAGNAIKSRMRDLAIMAGLGLGVLLSVVVSGLVNAGAGWLLGLVGLSKAWPGQVLLQVIAFAIVLAGNTALFLVVFRYLPGVMIPAGNLFYGALAGGGGISVLELFAGLLLRSASHNRFLAAFAVLVGLLIWMNLIARVALVAAAWAALDAEQSGWLETPAVADERARRQEVEAAVRRQQGQPAPSFGQRATDRTTLAAGVTLGLVAGVGLRLAGAAVRGFRRA